LDLRRDGKFLARPPGLAFSLREQRVMQQGGGLSRNRIQQLVVHFAQVAGANLAVQIKQTEKGTLAASHVPLAKRNAIHAADAVRYDAVPG